jgi:hypothetical protein
MLGFTTSIRQTSLGSKVQDPPRAVVRRELSGGGAPGSPLPGTVFS